MIFMRKKVFVMTKASDVLKVAVSQIGYAESPKNSNKTKYGAWFGENGVAWCAIYLDWVFDKAGAGSLYPHNSNAATAQDYVVSKCGGTWIMKKNTSKASRKAYLAKAKAGDIVDFDFGAMDAYRRHIGIVEKVSGNQIICIEGNTTPDGKSGSQSNGGMVCRKTRSYLSICSAVRPAYNAKPKTKPTVLPSLPKRGWLQKGDKGAEVAKMQNILIYFGFSCGGCGADADFGSGTKASVIAFQRKYGLSQDGGWGTKCNAKASELLGIKPAPKPAPKPVTKTSAQKIAEKAIECAYPSGTAKSKYTYPNGSPKPEYKAALNRAYPDRSSWGKQTRAGASCDVFVGTVIRDSGIDKSFPRGLDGVEKHCKGNAKWKLTGIKSESSMQRGDVIFQIYSGGGGHIAIYLGNGKVANAHYNGKSYGIIQKYSNEIMSASKCKTFNVYRAK